MGFIIPGHPIGQPPMPQPQPPMPQPGQPPPHGQFPPAAGHPPGMDGIVPPQPGIVPIGFMPIIPMPQSTQLFPRDPVLPVFRRWDWGGWQEGPGAF